MNIFEIPATRTVKVKWPCLLTEYNAMKAYWESEGTAPRILDLSTRLR
jgi:hypothetical protein